MRIDANYSPQARARWEPIVRKHLGSGLSIKKFAAKEGISATSLFGWNRRLKNLLLQEDQLKAAATLVPNAGTDFLPLLAESISRPLQGDILQEAGSDRRLLEIRFPSGIELKIAISTGDSCLVLESIRTLAEVLR